MENKLLQVRLNGVATGIGQAGLAVAILVFLILIIRYFSHYKAKKAGDVVSDINRILTIAVMHLSLEAPILLHKYADNKMNLEHCTLLLLKTSACCSVLRV